MLAVQGPRSQAILGQLAPEIEGVPYFGHTEAKIAGAPVTISRTGYTGDLGYEVRVGSDDALAVLDAVIDAGEGHGFRPFGEEALLMTRIEAGLVLINVEFSSSRLAYTDHDRITPQELGFGWMLKGIDGEDRPFIGRNAMRRELAEGASRWASVGIFLDWADYDRVYQEAGLVPPKDETPLEWESMLYDDEGERVGYATSLMYSPMLQRHIAMARVRPDLSDPGTKVNLELTINHEYQTVAAEVTRLPFFNPPRKTA
jgi:aminomethyltransferase